VLGAWCWVRSVLGSRGSGVRGVPRFGVRGVRGFARFGARRVRVPGSGRWPELCTTSDVAGARRPEELAAWHLAWELKQKVYAFTETGAAARDLDFRRDIRRAARSAPHNTAEGFYRYSPGDFAQFLNIARGSLGEVRDQLRHALDEKYLKDAEFAELLHLADRAIGANTNFQEYLRVAPAYFNRPRPRKRRPSPNQQRPNEQPPNHEP
jgi:four helix bundle protein